MHRPIIHHGCQYEITLASSMKTPTPRSPTGQLVVSPCLYNQNRPPPSDALHIVVTTSSASAAEANERRTRGIVVIAIKVRWRSLCGIEHAELNTVDVEINAGCHPMPYFYRDARQSWYCRSSFHPPLLNTTKIGLAHQPVRTLSI